MAKKSGTRLIVETVLGGAAGCLLAFLLLKYVLGIDLANQLSQKPQSVAKRPTPAVIPASDKERTQTPVDPVMPESVATKAADPIAPVEPAPMQLPLDNVVVAQPPISEPPKTPEVVSDDNNRKTEPIVQLRPRPPSAETQKSVRDKMDAVFETGKAKTDVHRLSVAKELQRVAAETVGKLDEKFVLLRTAAELAADAGEIRTSIQYVDRLAQDFDFNRLNAKQAFALRAADRANTSSEVNALLQVSNELGCELIDQGAYDEALALTQAVQKAAIRAMDKDLNKRVSELLAARKIQNSAWQAYANAASVLDLDAMDAEANLIAGHWHAGETRDWGLALQCFEKCNNEALAQVATADLKDPSKADGIEAVADEWFRLGSQGSENSSLLLRAGHWYQQLEVVGNGLAKEKAIRRSREIRENPKVQAMFKRAELLGISRQVVMPARPVAIPDSRPLLSQQSPEVISEEGRRTPFKESRSDGILVGFDVALAKFGRGYRGESIGALKPLYQTPTQLTEGAWHGTPKGETVRILAKPGFAVADLNVAIGGRIMGLQIEFRRVMRGRLDANVTYRSEWLGKQTDNVQTISSDSQPWNGVFGSWRTDDAWPSSLVSFGLQTPSNAIDLDALQNQLQGRFGPDVNAKGLVVWLDFEDMAKRPAGARQSWTCKAGTRIECNSKDIDLVDASAGCRAARISGSGLRLLSPLLNGTREYTFVAHFRIGKEGESTLLSERTSDGGYIGELCAYDNNRIRLATWNKNYKPDNWINSPVTLRSPITAEWCKASLRVSPGQAVKATIWANTQKYECDFQRVENDFPGYSVIGGKAPVEVAEMLFFKRGLGDDEIEALLKK